MEIAIEYSNIKPSHIHFDFVEKNKVIDNGYFIKLNYYNKENDITLYKINIASNTLEVNDYIKSIYNNKRKCYINYLYLENNTTNQNFTNFVKKVDRYFNKNTKEYCKTHNLNLDDHTYVGMLKNCEDDGILFRMPINSKNVHVENESNKYQIILRWNGIWISNNQYGLNYKIVLIVQK
jgi:hypothetical protein